MRIGPKQKAWLKALEDGGDASDIKGPRLRYSKRDLMRIFYTKSPKEMAAQIRLMPAEFFASAA